MHIANEWICTNERWNHIHLILLDANQTKRYANVIQELSEFARVYHFCVYVLHRFTQMNQFSAPYITYLTQSNWRSVKPKRKDICSFRSHDARALNLFPPHQCFFSYAQCAEQVSIQSMQNNFNSKILHRKHNLLNVIWPQFERAFTLAETFSQLKSFCFFFFRTTSFICVWTLTRISPTFISWSKIFYM